MGELKDMFAVGKPAPRGKGDTLPPATVVDPSAHIAYQGKKLKGAIVVSEKGLELQGERSEGFTKRIIRVPLVKWENVRRIEIDGHGYERQRGRTAFGFDLASGGSTVGRIGGTHSAATSNLVVNTDTQQVAWTLPISPVALRNILGKTIVAVENQGSRTGPAEFEATPPPPPPPPSALPPPPTMPAGWLPDPTDRHELRYWTGAQWSEHVSDAGLQTTDVP